MSILDHTALIQNLNEGILPFKKALHKLQCTCAELEEMLSVCVYMGGGPALMYAAETVKAWEAMAPHD